VKMACTVQRPAPPVELVNEVLKKAGRRVRAVKYLHSTSSTVRWPLWDGDTLHYYETSSGKEMAVLVTHPKRSRPFIRAIAAQKDRLYTWHVGWNGEARYNAIQLFLAQNPSQYVYYGEEPRLQAAE